MEIAPITQAQGRHETRDEIIRVGTELISRGGFNATGLDAILKTAGVPKGSFYHYFASKEEFGLAVIDNFAQEQNQRLESLLQDRNFPALTRIANFLDHNIEMVRACQCSRGCLIGELGQEMAAQNEAFRLRIERAFQSWRRHVAGCFEEARRAGEIPVNSDPDQLADFLQMGWQGAVLRAKVTKSVEPLKAFTDLFFKQVLRLTAPTAT